VNGRVIEFDALSDANRPGADDDDFLFLHSKGKILLSMAGER
jgi:hypothetical protein